MKRTKRNWKRKLGIKHVEHGFFVTDTMGNTAIFNETEFKNMIATAIVEYPKIDGLVWERGDKMETTTGTIGDRITQLENLVTGLTEEVTKLKATIKEVDSRVIENYKRTKAI